MTAVSLPNSLEGTHLLTAMFEELRGSQQETERFIDTVFDQLQDCLLRLNDRYAELEATNAQWEQARDNAESDALARCTELEQQLDAVREESAQNRAAEQQALEELTAQRDALRQQVSELRNSGGGRPGEAESLDAHCQALEDELETVRARASALSESLEETERKLEAERTEWTHELKQMRQAIEKQPPLAAQADAPSAATTAPVSGSAKTADPSQVVVGSVMAQFEKLRSQRAQRRSARN